MIRTFFHILFSPIYLVALIMLAILFAGLIFFTWLFELDRPPTKEDYYMRFP